jgi:hypothetical protein
MRLWSIHPEYLDPQGLVALWRETLLAQAVLRGQTKGYTHHPQLSRFREAGRPIGCIAEYLRAIAAEAARRGYKFDATKIARATWDGTLTVSRGQVEYEWTHLRKKLAARSPAWLRGVGAIERPKAHPLFRIVPGGVAEWERV